MAKLKALLDSRSDRDIIDGLKRVVAMIYQNKPALPYFSSVVKNVANPNIEVKKLVYIYLLHYAESDPDLALLSVNAIQKSLTDQNPQVRALALRTMAGMRVPVISQIVSLAIKRGVADLSPHVRKAAVLAIPKCYRLDPNTLPLLLDCLSTLLADKQYLVVGPAVQVFLDVCPDRVDLIHKHYRTLVQKLVDMDEWGQLATLRLLLFYSRQCFPRKTKPVAKINKSSFYEDESDKEVEDQSEQISAIDPDLESLLTASRLLLTSRSAAVVVAASSCLIYLGDNTHSEAAIGPLVALLRSPLEIQQIVLPNIVSVALQNPALVLPYTTHFLISHPDTPQIWMPKMELLTLVFVHANNQLKSLILNELEHFAHSTELDRIQESVRAIGRCAQSDPRSSSRCFKLLLAQLSSFDNALVSEVLTVMRHLIQRDPANHRKTIVRLARNLDRTTSPEARATIIWLVGEFGGLDNDNNIAPDVLRILIRGFADEAEESKLQIVLLAAKVYLQFLHENRTTGSQNDGRETNGSSQRDETSQTLNTNHPIARIWSYLLALVRYDTSYDLRDRTRMFRALLSDPTSTQLASLIIAAPKPIPHVPSPSESRQGLLLGTTTMVLGADQTGSSGLPGYEKLPDWVESGREPDAKLRDDDDAGAAGAEYVSEAKRVAQVAASQRLDEAVKEQGLEGVVKRREKSLDAWLDESESESQSDDETETEAETTDEETDEEDEEDEEGETESEEQSSNEDNDQAKQGLIKK